jgi:hypothetical protein
MQDNPTHKAKTIYGDWIEGWYDGSNKIHLIWNDIEPVDMPDVINPTTLCRSTYRQDSNGNMMYEGDEVEVDGKPFIIEWNTESCGFMLASNQYLHDITFYGTYTLTGKNKHD